MFDNTIELCTSHLKHIKESFTLLITPKVEWFSSDLDFFVVVDLFVLFFALLFFLFWLLMLFFLCPFCFSSAQTGIRVSSASVNWHGSGAFTFCARTCGVSQEMFNCQIKRIRKITTSIGWKSKSGGIASKKHTLNYKPTKCTQIEGNITSTERQKESHQTRVPEPWI